MNKHINGYVTQTFEGDKCVRQYFFSDDKVEYTENGTPTEGDLYHPMSMVQPYVIDDLRRLSDEEENSDRKERIDAIISELGA